MTVFDEFTFWHWLIAGVLLIVLEIFAPGVVFMWVGIAAILTGVIAWLAPDLSVQWQMLVFAALAVSSVVAGRQWIKRNPTETDHPTLSNRGAKYVDRRFVLDEAIVGGFGKIKVDDTTWKVSGDDMDAGTHVVVTGIEGTVLTVEKQD
ncbi:NfeD family protein [Pseudomonadota bacterium]